MYQAFHLSRIGASHIKNSLPCQDASLSMICPEGEIAIVADGHGNRKHFRSDRGSQIACEVARDRIQAFLGEDSSEDAELDLFEEPDMNHLLTKLKQEILTGWIEAVCEDVAAHPWTEEELFEQEELLRSDQFDALVSGREVLVPYGSTLLAAFTFEGGWAAVQIGDGCMVRITRDGEYEWPMPESAVNDGNKTASLCMSNAMAEFRHCFGEDAGAGLFVVSDGIEKSFPTQGKEITSLLHWIWKNEHGQSENRMENLRKTLDMITNRSPAGDDISVAGLVDLSAEDVEPKASKKQKELVQQRLLAQLTEIENTIQYNEERLAQAKTQSADTSDVEAQLQTILERKKAAASELWDKAELLRIEIEGPEATPAVPYETRLAGILEQIHRANEPIKQEKPVGEAGKAEPEKDKGKGKSKFYEMLEMWGKL